MTTDKETTAKLVVFGRAGDTIHYVSPWASSATVSGYGSPERPHAANPDKYTIPDGTPALDLREACLTKEGFTWALKGPLVDATLADSEAKPCTMSGNDAHVVSALAETNRSFAGMLALQACAGKERGPLDCVSVAEYVEGWRLHGARVGRYEKGRITWPT